MRDINELQFSDIDARIQVGAKQKSILNFLCEYLQNTRSTESSLPAPQFLENTLFCGKLAHDELVPYSQVSMRCGYQEQL